MSLSCPLRSSAPHEAMRCVCRCVPGAAHGDVRLQPLEARERRAVVGRRRERGGERAPREHRARPQQVRAGAALAPRAARPVLRQRLVRAMHGRAASHRCIGHRLAPPRYGRYHPAAHEAALSPYMPDTCCECSHCVSGYAHGKPSQARRHRTLALLRCPQTSPHLATPFPSTPPHPPAFPAHRRGRRTLLRRRRACAQGPNAAGHHASQGEGRHRYHPPLQAPSHQNYTPWREHTAPSSAGGALDAPLPYHEQRLDAQRRGAVGRDPAGRPGARRAGGAHSASSMLRIAIASRRRASQRIAPLSS